MEFETILADPRKSALVLTINRADQRNAINPSVMRELISGLETAREDDGIRSVVITGAGDKAFCAGGDLAGGTMEGGAVAQHLDRALLSQVFRAMRELGKPVVARVNGHALGGGFGLALACDLVVAAEHAEFGTPEINVGLWPYIITSVIQRNVPPKIALEMMMLGKRLPAADAAKWGMVNRVVEAAQLDQAVDDLVEELASKSPLILRLGKDAFYVAEDMSFTSALSYLENQLSIGLQAEDVAEGIQAFFQKRRPEWKGR